MPTQTYDAESRADLASRLRRGVLITARRLRAKRTADLSEGQFSVLAQLEVFGPSTQSDVAARECVSAPSMTRTTAGLVEAGLVCRGPHPKDGRVVVVDITEAGRETLRATRERRDAWLATQLEGLADDELDTLSRAADILRRVSAE